MSKTGKKDCIANFQVVHLTVIQRCSRIVISTGGLNEKTQGVPNDAPGTVNVLIITFA